LASRFFPFRPGIGVKDDGRTLLVWKILPGIPDYVNVAGFGRWNVFFKDKGLQTRARRRELLNQFFDQLIVPRR
jgi:hypothetical protein